MIMVSQTLVEALDLAQVSDALGVGLVEHDHLRLGAHKHSGNCEADEAEIAGDEDRLAREAEVSGVGARE
jgi:hypothetical protein